MVGYPLPVSLPSARTLHVLLLGCGAALLGILITRVGPAAIVGSFSRLSWRLFLAVGFLFLCTATANALAWRFAFQRDCVPLRALLLARLAGEAFNLTTPLASVGGEPVKAWLLREHVPLQESAASVLVAKTTHVIAQGMFLLVAVGGAWWLFPAHSPLLRGMEWLLALEVVAVGGFVLVQVEGVLHGLQRVPDRLGLPGVGARARSLVRVASALSTLYRRTPRRLFLSIGNHFTGWMLGVLETYLILRSIGAPVSGPTALVIEGFGTGVRFATFWVPAGIGVMEGGQMAAFVALGLGAPAGLSLALIQRAFEAVWVGVGFLALAVVRPSAPLPPGRAAGA